MGGDHGFSPAGAVHCDLARHEILMTLRPLSDEVIREIVVEVFLPFVGRDREKKEGKITF